MARPSDNKDDNLTHAQNGVRRKPRSLRQHVLRRLVIVIPAACLALLAAKMGWLPVAADKVQFDNLAWFDNTKLTEHLRLLVKNQGLLDAPRRCVVPIINGVDPPDATHVEFLVRATDGCPGVNGKTATAFTVLVNKADRTLQTDAGTPGQYHPMAVQ